MSEDVDLFYMRDGHGLSGASIEDRRQPALRFFYCPFHQRPGLGPHSGDLLTRPLSDPFGVAPGLFDQGPGQGFGFPPGPLEEIVPDLSGFFMGGLNEPRAFSLLGLSDEGGGLVFGLLDLLKGPGGSVLDGFIILDHVSRSRTVYYIQSVAVYLRTPFRGKRIFGSGARRDQMRKVAWR